MKIDINKLQNYGLESIVILFSVILSFYVENQREEISKNEEKNKLIKDLINTIDEDLTQLLNIQESTNNAIELFNEIQNDVNSKNKILKQKDIVSKLISAKVGFSFFPQEGIFNQLISTGTFELIEKKELKSLLLKIYNHQNSRNKAISNQIDLFTIEFENKIFKNFRIDFKNNNLEGYIYGKTTVENYDFNQKFYYSNEFFGLLSRAKQWGYQYTRLLNDIKKNYNQAKIYALNEIE